MRKSSRKLGNRIKSRRLNHNLLEIKGKVHRNSTTRTKKESKRNLGSTH